MYGIVLAFKDYMIVDGILGSPWVGFKHFNRLFSSASFFELITNTLTISFQRILFGFPAPIIFALLLNEIKVEKFKKIVQSISYLPHFMSWVILGGIVMELLSPTRGVINYIITIFGGEPIYFLTEVKYFRTILIVSGIWAGVGWGSIIYLAAISGIDIQQYEAAVIEGASRFQRAIYITLPSIMPVISISFILNIGGIMNAGFDQIFNLYNPMVYKVADILDTYVYRVGIQDMEYSFSTAVGLFKNVVGLIMVVITNFITSKLSNNEYGLW